ncbi:hypothetical protein BS78_02G063000 [Paspalum vaginatum]|nr:hypothetical protein BS78_02G063000 [Paspalum vaginatum]
MPLPQPPLTSLSVHLLIAVLSEMEAPPRLACQNYVDDAWHSGSKGAVEGQPALCLGVAASSPLNRAVPERKEKEKDKKEKSKSKEKEEKEKSKKPSAGRLILGVVVAAVGVVVVGVAGAFILLSEIGDSVDQEEDDPGRSTMKAPGSGGQTICRERFEENPKNYFRTQRERGSKAAVDDYQ